MYRRAILIRPGETKDSRGARRLRTAVRDADPGIFALVMATCIVSRAMQLDGAGALSGILLAAGIAAYLVLAAVYAGRFAEQGDARSVFAHPAHPYTRELLASTISLSTTELHYIPGSPPDPREPPSGCRFHPRCPHCLPDNADLYLRQTTQRPRLREVAPDHFVACHLVEA